MAWESRHGTKALYYYRVKRVDGRVRKTCYGSGPGAELVASHDAMARAARHDDTQAAQREDAQCEPLDRLANELDAGVETLVDAAILACGFHLHRGELRRRRHGCTK